MIMNDVNHDEAMVSTFDAFDQSNPFTHLIHLKSFFVGEFVIIKWCFISQIRLCF